MITVTNPALYYRRKDGSPSEPLNAATFHQVARTMNNIIIDLERLHIADVDKSKRTDRQLISDAVQAATNSLNDLSEFLKQVQDHPKPVACLRCAGMGWTELPGDGYRRKPCTICDGVGLLEEAVILST